jgi:hypothetical protein
VPNNFLLALLLSTSAVYDCEDEGADANDGGGGNRKDL